MSNFRSCCPNLNSTWFTARNSLAYGMPKSSSQHQLVPRGPLQTISIRARSHRSTRQVLPTLLAQPVEGEGLPFSLSWLARYVQHHPITTPEHPSCPEAPRTPQTASSTTLSASLIRSSPEISFGRRASRNSAKTRLSCAATRALWCKGPASVWNRSRREGGGI